MSDSDRLPEIVSYWKLEDDFILYSDLDNSDKDSDKEEYFFINPFKHTYSSHNYTFSTATSTYKYNKRLYINFSILYGT